MEDELKCFICKQYYNVPVILPCHHSLCLNCAIRSQTPVLPGTHPSMLSPPAVIIVQTKPQEISHVPVIESGCSSEISSCSSDISGDSDKLSVVSEADSGVICNVSNSSRPNSYLALSVTNTYVTQTFYSIVCIQCSKVVYFDENGAKNLPRNRALQNAIDRYFESKNSASSAVTNKCQLCETQPPLDATVMCEQCEIFYCDGCKVSCHPARGPLAKHFLVPPSVGNLILKSKNQPPKAVFKDSNKCMDHGEEVLTTFCSVCRVSICARCLQEGRHGNHDVQPLSFICKQQKTDLSMNLQALSEQAKHASEFMQRLKSMIDTVSTNCTNFESVIGEQIESLVAHLRSRQQQLNESVRRERDFRIASLKEQVGMCAVRLQNTTALVQLCIELLKETDASAFLQVVPGLVDRVTSMELSWRADEAVNCPNVSNEFDFSLDQSPLIQAVQQLNFAHVKPPRAPVIIAEECSAENNSVTLLWQPHQTSLIDGFILELDDGNDGAFREVYCGKETVCTVDGLHFNSIYNARVKAFNSIGEGEYSQPISLQTADVAWFTFDSRFTSPDARFSNDNRTVQCEGYDHRVILGNIGFARGVHYWEFSVDRYDTSCDPAFGVARRDACRDQMLGKDSKGWSMYVDHQRSWFLHGDQHHSRTDGGISIGCTVGVLLDLEQHQLIFYINQEPQGPVAFTDLKGCFYPAVSLNRNVAVTLHTGLDPPSTDVSSDENS